MLQKYFDLIVFDTNNWSLTVGQLTVLILLTFLLIWAFIKVKSKLLPFLYKRYSFLKRASTLINKSLLALFWVAIVFIVLDFFHFELILIDNDFIKISISTILKILTLYLFARLFKWIIIDILYGHYYYKKIRLTEHKDIEGKTKTIISNVTKYAIYTSIILWSMQILHFDLSHTFSIHENDGSPLIRVISLSKILGALLIMLGMRMLIWIINELILRGIYEKREIDYSHQFALNQLTKYFVYIITFIILLDYMGINLTIIWGSAAALLVGIGLGLQDTFKDFVSGVVLLFEHSLGVGDVLEFNNEVGVVTEIGIRASLIETNDKITVVVPNSQIVNQAVNNWTFPDKKVRLEIAVGVAYGSDVEKVKNVLLEAALLDKSCTKIPKPTVLFDDFSSSSLDFKLLFFTKDLLQHRQVKSRIRFNINQLFTENNIKIPFPQRDVHIQQQ